MTAASRIDDMDEETTSQKSIRRSLLYRVKHTQRQRMYQSKEYSSRQDMTSSREFTSNFKK